MMSVMVAFVGTAVETSKSSITDLDTFRARAAAKNTATLAIAELWADFNKSSGEASGVASFKTFLDQQGMVTPELSSSEPIKRDFKETLGLKKDKEGSEALQNVTIDRAEMFRVDTAEATSIVVEVDATANRRPGDKTSKERHGSIRETFTISSPSSGGVDFGILAEEASCLFCHTTIDSAERVYNSDSRLTGSFAPVKAGFLGNLGLRTDAASEVAGMILSRGSVHDVAGGAISDWSAYDVEALSAGANGELEVIHENALGDPTLGSLRPFSEGVSDANLYAEITPGMANAPEMPEEIPAVIADDGGFDYATGEARPEFGGNRLVDDTEFAVKAATANGSLSGGKISVIGQGSTIATPAEQAAMRAGLETSLSASTAGHVYLRGTEQDPILLDGSIAIDGDVIISGVVKGTGNVTARGNVFIASDLTYADQQSGTSRSFGRAADGTENLLTLAAGGNIVVGDYFRSNDSTEDQPGISGDSTGDFNATLQEISIFNRSEWSKTQPQVPGPASEWTQIGTESVEYPEVITETYYEWVTDDQSSAEIPTDQLNRTADPLQTPFVKEAQAASFTTSANSPPGVTKKKKKKKSAKSKKSGKSKKSDKSKKSKKSGKSKKSAKSKKSGKSNKSAKAAAEKAAAEKAAAEKAAAEKAAAEKAAAEKAAAEKAAAEKAAAEKAAAEKAAAEKAAAEKAAAEKAAAEKAAR